MKAVILEVKDNYAAALYQDGCVVKVENKNYEKGQVIRVKNTKMKHIKLWAGSIAAAFIMFMGIGAWAYATPYTYVSLDVNPSIEYTLNRFDRVLKVTAVNDDGLEIVKEYKLDEITNKKIEDALRITIDKIAGEGFFDGEDAGLVISTSGKNDKKAEGLAENLQEKAVETTQENGVTVEVEASSVGKTRVEKAKELGVTPGKLNLVEKLQASAENPDDIDIEEWLNKPVKDIMKATKENKKAAKAAAKVELDDDDLYDDEDNDDDYDDDDDDDDVVDSKKAQKEKEKAEKEKEKAEEKARKEALKESKNDKVDDDDDDDDDDYDEVDEEVDDDDVDDDDDNDDDDNGHDDNKEKNNKSNVNKSNNNKSNSGKSNNNKK